MNLTNSCNIVQFWIFSDILLQSKRIMTKRFFTLDEILKKELKFDIFIRKSRF